MIDYTTWRVIGQGTERTCYQHPENPARCVKIIRKSRFKQTLREISYFGYLKRKGVPFDHLPRFYGKIEGEGFIGIEQELIRDTVPPGKSADMFTPPGTICRPCPARLSTSISRNPVPPGRYGNSWKRSTN
ncbi:PhoP regulatory network YrbL family protein [Oxalobacter sp. JAC-2022]|uniref:YrbL family protein n=1 Tax=Oxalobacter aliiformigenes TaxID=2946593 RepID=UPI0022AEBCEC|nr:YrbL family protein [Oxalobacter aliiformigenes]MCZ4065153.1 PhoP regulatory network YrbL family protein [Oxalobacter aliiformigenes]